jgi:hypothetical protein
MADGLTMRALMWNWMNRWKAPAGPDARAHEPASDLSIGKVMARPRKVAGKHADLYDYLEHRYADVVVLTFGQIEDLLGFALPDAARTRAEWWAPTDPDGDRSPFSEAWTSAGRTASPNLLARTVTFERGTSSR